MTRRPSRARAQDVAKLAFRHPVRPTAAIEVVSLPELRAKATDAFLARPRRADFHHLFFVTAGSLRIEVDFVEHRMGPRTMIAISPAQVHRFEASSACDGYLVLFTDEVLSREVRVALGACESVVRVPGDDAATVGAMIAWLATWTVRDDPRGRRAIHLLATVVETLRLHRGPEATANEASRSDVFQIFTQTVERHFQRTRKLERYADLTGFAIKTLGRAAREHAGMSAKQLVDRRVLLEARRLLAHSDRTVGAIADELAFSEATNFVKFFERLGGESPMSFRRRVCGVGARRSRR